MSLDDNGCQRKDSSIIVEPLSLTYVLTTSNPNCFGEETGEISLVINGGVMPYEAIYSSGQVSYPTNNSAIISNLPAGSDSVYLHDANGCENNFRVNLISPLELVVDDITITNNMCYEYADGSVSIVVTGGSAPYDYELLDNLGAIINTTPATIGLSTGMYIYQILDQNNCFASATITIDSPPEIEIIQQPSCYGSILVEVLNAAGAYNIFWTEDNMEDSVYVDGLVAGQYIVTVIDDSSCVKVDSFIVDKVFDYSIIPASCVKVADGIINIDNINLGIAPYSIYLNDELLGKVTNTMEIANLLTGEYMLTVIDNDDCHITESLLVDVISDPSACIQVPTIISPNGDGENDSWHPIYDIDAEIEVTILNRWGQVEYYYQGNSLVFEWDGVGKGGNHLPSTDYYYIIKYQNNSYSDRTGVVTLIR